MLSAKHMTPLTRTLAGSSIVSWFMISLLRRLCRRLPWPWAPALRWLLPQAYTQSVDWGVFKCRHVAPGSMGGCSGSLSYIGSAKLNIAWLHSTKHMTMSVPELGLCTTRWAYWQICDFHQEPAWLPATGLWTGSLGRGGESMQDWLAPRPHPPNPVPPQPTLQ